MTTQVHVNFMVGNSYANAVTRTTASAPASMGPEAGDVITMEVLQWGDVELLVLVAPPVAELELPPEPVRPPVAAAPPEPCAPPEPLMPPDAAPLEPPEPADLPPEPVDDEPPLPAFASAPPSSPPPLPLVEPGEAQPYSASSASPISPRRFESAVCRGEVIASASDESASPPAPSSWSRLPGSWGWRRSPRLHRTPPGWRR